MKHLILIAAVAATAAPTALPTPVASPSPPPALAPAPSPSPAVALVRFSGQILDLRDGYIFFTTGDGFRLSPGYRTVNATNGGSTTLPAVTRMYARASFDPQSGQVVEVALSRTSLPFSSDYETVRHFAVEESTPYANPDLVPQSAGGNGPNEHYTGRIVQVRFTVQVPPTTPLSDDVYITTDQSLWNPMAIKLIRVDALHYRIDKPFASGTKLQYLYTRGTWRSVERGEDGLEEKPRTFVVPESDTKNRTDIVYHWADESQGSSINPAAGIPTPYNPQPFVTP